MTRRSFYLQCCQRARTCDRHEDAKREEKKRGKQRSSQEEWAEEIGRKGVEKKATRGVFSSISLVRSHDA